MKEKQEYRSSKRSRRLIREAFLELLEERDLDKITVVEIVNRAYVTRSTFYAHYPDVYGIIEEIQNEIISRHLEEFSHIEYRTMLHDPIPYLKSVAGMLEENRTLFKKMGQGIQVKQYMEVLQKTLEEDIIKRSDIPEEVKNPCAFSIRVHFFHAGVLSTFQQWADGTIECTLDELCQEVSHLIRQSATDFMDTDWMQQ